MALSCNVHVQTVAFNLFLAGMAGSTEQSASRWVMTCLRILEEVDAANLDGVGLLLGFDSSEKDVAYTVSKVQRLSSATTWVRGVPHSDVAYTWEGGGMRFCCMSCFSRNLVASQATPCDLACFLPSGFPHLSIHSNHPPYPCTSCNSMVHGINQLSCI